jgi:hypothetical protein
LIVVASMLLFADYDAVSAKDSRFGAVGDGASDDTAPLQAALDHCFGPSEAPHGTANVRENKALYVPPGHYKISTPLTIKYLHGARIIGAGRFVTQIEQATPGASVFVTNGCGYARFEGMRLTAAAGGKCFDLDWDGSAGGPALQSNTFRRHIFRWRRNRRRDRTFRLYGVGKPLPQLLLACMFDCGPAHVERECFAADDHRRQLSGLQSRDLRGRWLSPDHPRRRLSDVRRLRHLYRHALQQCHERARLPQRERELYQQRRRPVAACGRLQPRGQLQRLFPGSIGRLRGRLGLHLESGQCGAHVLGIDAHRKFRFKRDDWLLLTPSQLWWKPNNPRSFCLELENLTGGSTEIRRERLATPDGQTITTLNYQSV